MRTFEEPDHASIKLTLHSVQGVFNVFAFAQLACPATIFQLTGSVCRHLLLVNIESDFLETGLKVAVSAQDVAQGAKGLLEGIQGLLARDTERPVKTRVGKRPP